MSYRIPLARLTALPPEEQQFIPRTYVQISEEGCRYCVIGRLVPAVLQWACTSGEFRIGGLCLYHRPVAQGVESLGMTVWEAGILQMVNDRNSPRGEENTPPARYVRVMEFLRDMVSLENQDLGEDQIELHARKWWAEKVGNHAQQDPQ